MDADDFEDISTVADINQWTRQTLPAILASVHQLCPSCHVTLLAAAQLEWVEAAFRDQRRGRRVWWRLRGLRTGIVRQRQHLAGVAHYLAGRPAHIQQHELKHAPSRRARRRGERAGGTRGAAGAWFRAAERQRFDARRVLDGRLLAPGEDGIGLAGGGMLSAAQRAAGAHARSHAGRRADRGARCPAGSGAFGAYVCDGWNWLDCGLLVRRRSCRCRRRGTMRRRTGCRA